MCIQIYNLYTSLTFITVFNSLALGKYDKHPLYGAGEDEENTEEMIDEKTVKDQ
jgi:hypothetical protein